MVDTSDWGGLPDVKLDRGAAQSLISACNSAASQLRSQATRRKALTNDAMRDFDGRFSRIFQENQRTADADAEEIADALEKVAKAVDYVVGLVPEENARRRAAREWKARRDEEKKHVTLSDLGGDEAPPEGPTSPPPSPDITASAKPRETPQPGSGGGYGSGTSSARPGELRSFSSGMAGSIQQLAERPSRLRGLNADFTAGFDWGLGEAAGVDGSAVFSALGQYNQLNRQDRTWVDAVASAFEEAGGSGGMVTLSNAALASSLAAAGVAVSRLDIAPTSPRLYGISPTTGYADDPVNAATGNFVEPEVDLVFEGGTTSLVLTRMYNSFQRDAGGFGPGWCSWSEVRLAFDEELAQLRLPDGRVLQFPRLGDGWGRALGAATWLERDEVADELRVTDNDGGTWRFTTAGVPLSHDRGAGTLVSFVHEGGRLVRLQHERGRHVALVWDADRIVAAEASDGRRLTYAYDEQHRLVGVTGPAGTRTYRWDDAGFVAAVVDADGVVEVDNTYDPQGRVLTQLSPHGRTSRYSYLPGNVTEVSDLDGTRANTYVHDGRGNLVGLVDSEGHRQSTSYDQHNNPLVLTERDGSVTVRKYDDRGHLVREVLASGADLRYGYDDLDRVVSVVTEEGAETRVEYAGAARNPSLVVDPEGGELRMEWERGLMTRLVDPTGVELRLGYDEHGDLVSTTNAVGDTARLERDATGRVTVATTPSGHRTTFVHGPAGLAERHDPDGGVWRFERTAAGRLTAVVDPTGARLVVEHGADGEERRLTDPTGRSIGQVFDDLGNLTSLELPDGSAWQFGHDALSRLVTTTTPAGETWTRAYDQVGNLVATIDPDGGRTAVSIDRSAGTVTERGAAGSMTRRYDRLGRPVAAEAADGDVAVATYDRCGRVVEQLDGEGGLTRIRRDLAGRPVAVTDPTGRTTRFEHDACGRLHAVVAPDGGRTTTTYDADSRPVRVTLPTGEVAWTDYDACGRVRSTFVTGVGASFYRHDAAGRVVEVRDTVSGLRRFEHDAAGRVVAATDGNGGTTRYGLDERGRTVEIVDPMGHVTRREFDLMDRCVAETDPLGRTTRAGYDACGRQAWQEDALGHRTEWTYDGAGRITSVSLDGRPLARLTRDAATRTVVLRDTTRPDGREVVHEARWNRRGQLVSSSRDGRSMSWSHDAAGRRETMTLPDGDRVEYAYDAAGRLAAVEHPSLGRVELERDGSGRVVTATAGDLVQSWTYAGGFVVDHVVTDAEGSTRTVVERDDRGRIRRLDRGGEATTYTHDDACQLVGARSGRGDVRWRYDASGRIVEESGTDGTAVLSYDAGGQLVAVDGPDGTTRHEYDGLGRRVRTVRPDGATRELEWSPTGWLAAVTDVVADRTVRTRLHVDASGALASVDGTEVFWDSAVPYAPPLAQVGTTSVVSVGAVTGVGDQWASPGWRGSRADAGDVWGVVGATVAAAGLPAGVSISPAGQLSIGDLEWLGARVYDARSRGFLSTDPLDPVTAAGWSGNPYSYAGNDPLHALDPTGLKPVSEADLKAANQPPWEQAWNATTQWVSDNTEYLIGGALVVAGVAAMFIPVPVVGQALGGALISMGTETIVQRAQNGKDGELNVSKILVAGAVGAIGGGTGAALKTATMSTTKIVATKIAVDTATGAGGNMANYALDHRGEDFKMDEFLKQGAQGAGGGFIGGATAAKFDPLSDAAGTAAARRLGAVIPEVGDQATELTLKQTVAKGAAEMGVKTVSNAESDVLTQTLTEGDLDGRKFVENMAKGTIGGVASRTGHESMTINAPTAPAP